MKHSVFGRCRLLLWSLLPLVCSTVLGRDFSPQTHFYAAEYMKPQPGSRGVPILNVIFDRKIQSQSAERTLRAELQQIITLFPPQGDVLAYAWVQSSAQPSSEEMMDLVDGSTFLIYSSKVRKVLTEKQYDVAMRPSGKPGKEIHVSFNLALQRGPDGQVRVSGDTNLPTQMPLMISLRREGSHYFAQDQVSVVNGHIASTVFSDNGKVLPTGIYQIEVSSPLPELQPPSVRGVIGPNGENLKGPVQSSMGSNMVDYKTRTHLQ